MWGNGFFIDDVSAEFWQNEAYKELTGKGVERVCRSPADPLLCAAVTLPVALCHRPFIALSLRSGCLCLSPLPFVPWLRGRLLFITGVAT